MFTPQISALDTCLSSYTFDLPDALIAQEPPEKRGSSRLMVHDRQKGEAFARAFDDLPKYLPKGVMVVNNSRVIPARVFGTRESGGKVEFLLTTPLPHIQAEDTNGIQTAVVDCLLRSSKKVKEGETVRFNEHFAATLVERKEYGQCSALLSWKGRLSESLLSNGHLPLPPYIKRPQSADDMSRYQTVYADPAKAGSVAAPTAGLHFTPEMRARLEQAGMVWAEVTLYVGYGTFSPVRHENILEHTMHGEYCEINEENARIINSAKEKGLPVTAVGTTAARTLEGVNAKAGGIVPFSGWTDIFLYPGKPLKVVDHLLTNFHLPESTLLMLVSAFAGREAILRTYEMAVRERFRFFSYGDAMLIL